MNGGSSTRSSTTTGGISSSSSSTTTTIINNGGKRTTSTTNGGLSLDSQDSDQSTLNINSNVPKYITTTTTDGDCSAYITKFDELNTQINNWSVNILHFKLNIKKSK